MCKAEPTLIKEVKLWHCKEENEISGRMYVASDSQISVYYGLLCKFE